MSEYKVEEASEKSIKIYERKNKTVIFILYAKEKEEKKEIQERAEININRVTLRDRN